MPSKFPNPDAWDGDPVTLVEQAAEILRLSVTDPDYARLTRLSYVAVQEIKDYLDWPVPFDDTTVTEPVPDTIYNAGINLLVETYRRKDSPFGIANAWGQDGVSLRIPADVLAGALSEIRPEKQRFGVG